MSMTPVQARLKEVRDALPAGVRLVAVSKFHPAGAIEEAYAAGQRLFGESHVQEMDRKRELLPRDIEWHFIGHLQTNKVKRIVPYVSMIHAVDSERLLAEIDRQAARAGRVVPCLVEVRVAAEETKYGFLPGECLRMLEEGRWRGCAHARIAGLMGMATNTADEARVEREFRSLAALFAEARRRFFADDDTFRELSMGMSGDYPLAVRAGSTLVRVGSRIFGERAY